MAARFRQSPRNSAWRSGFRVVAPVLLLSLPLCAQDSKWAKNLAPYVVSPQHVVERMLEIANVHSGELVYDLGSGDGRVLITAAQRFNARAVGYEISPRLVKKADEHIGKLGLQDRIRVVQGDLMQADLSPADVVVIYLLTLSNDMLRPRLEKQLKPGARVVSYSFQVPGWKPVRIDRTDAHEGHSIYLYEMPPARK